SRAWLTGITPSEPKSRRFRIRLTRRRQFRSTRKPRKQKWTNTKLLRPPSSASKKMERQDWKNGSRKLWGQSLQILVRQWTNSQNKRDSDLYWTELSSRE